MTRAVVDEIVNAALQRFPGRWSSLPRSDGHSRGDGDLGRMARHLVAMGRRMRETWRRIARAGARRTAGNDCARAALYYHYGQCMLVDDLALKRKMHDRKLAAFIRAAPMLDPPMERVEIPFTTSRWPAIFACRPASKRRRASSSMGGLDTTKEDYLTINDLCLQRGLATLWPLTAQVKAKRSSRCCGARTSSMPSTRFSTMWKPPGNRPESHGHHGPQHRRPLRRARAGDGQTGQGHRGVGRDVPPAQHR